MCTKCGSFQAKHIIHGTSYRLCATCVIQWHDERTISMQYSERTRNSALVLGQSLGNVLARPYSWRLQGLESVHELL